MIFFFIQGHIHWRDRAVWSYCSGRRRADVDGLRQQDSHPSHRKTKEPSGNKLELSHLDFGHG